MHAGTINGVKVTSTNESKARVVLCALKEALQWGLRKIHLFSDALELIQAINGVMDWSKHSIFWDSLLFPISQELLMVLFMNLLRVLIGLVFCWN